MSIEAAVTKYEAAVKNLPSGMKNPSKVLSKSFSAPWILTMRSRIPTKNLLVPGALNWEKRFHIDQYAFVADDREFPFINCDMGHLFRSAHEHTCILLLTNELKPGSDKLQGYSCELQRVTSTVRSMVLIIIDFNGSHERPIFFHLQY